MARIAATREDFVDWILDVVLFKTGLLLSESELLQHVVDSRLVGNQHDSVSLRAEELEAIVHVALYELGHVATPTPETPSLALLRKYGGDPRTKAIVDAIEDLAWENAKQAALTAWGQPIDLMPVLLAAKEKLGTVGLGIAFEWHDRVVAHVQGSPWSRMRRVNWISEAALADLFESASLQTPHGTFLDQRYIDYLAAQFGAIDRVHWRKFEALTCEYFARVGARVEIGPGSNDDGVDARVWWPDDPPGAPPALLIQCKRERDTIGKVVLKALYADMQWEKASSGLIVTTQRLARGTEAVRVARGYAIEQADRAAVRTWVESMRSTGEGLL